MELPRSRKALAQARRGHDEMVAAWDSDDDFDYRFVICMALLMRVGTTIEDEVRGHKSSDFSAWWERTADAQPLFRYLRDVRNDELKVTMVRTAAQYFPRSIRLAAFSMTHRFRPRSRMFNRRPAKTVLQPSLTQDSLARPPSSAIIGPSTSRVFVRGDLAGHDALPIVSQYLGWLDETLLPGAEAHTAPDAPRPIA
ncbi:MAG: hypothetical protein M3082_21465 [Candidatus Dormibacteraeota bacterium]|nr:hypothetical protein [Candidatus Dormibacteraeota bacterium]